MTSWKTPTAEQVTRAAVALARPEAASYFFSKLANPRWIKPLDALGFFKTPPPEQTEKDGISFPLWPAALFPVRMAAEDGESAGLTVEIVLGANSSNNHLVHLSYLDLALAVPAALAVRLAEQERMWLANQSWLYSLLPEKFAEVAVHLVQGGFKKEGIKLARTLLSFLPELSSDREPRGRIDWWHYDRVLKRIVPAVQERDALESLWLLSDLLGECGKRYGGISPVWRPSIEDSEQNWDLQSIADLLVDATRGACENVIRAKKATPDEVLAVLAKKSDQGIFARLRLHVVRTFRGETSARAEEALLDTAQIHSLEVRHEYALLMRDQFGALRPDQQKVVLDAISQGPRSENRDRSTPELQADFDLRSRYWKLERLSAIRDSLPPDWLEVYRGLVEEFGEPQHPDFVSYHTMWHGPESPKSADDLKSMSLQALVEYLVVWRPTRDFMAPSPEGLGRVLQHVVAESPERFLADADQVRRLHPTYVRGVIAGLAASIKSGKALDLNIALSLGKWAVGQRELPYPLSGEFIDSDWSWTRRAVVDLLTATMTAKGGAPIAMREEIWQSLHPLLNDPEPTPQAENLDSGDFEPGTVALNTVRGSAFHALVQYALWIRRWQETQPDAQPRIASGFGETPEIPNALDAHLDPTRDPSVAVRSVYGQWFPWLVMMDKDWARAATSKIFPLAPEEKDRHDAAWLAYLAHNHPYRNVIELLHDQYVAAAGLADAGTRFRIRSLRAPARSLGEHLLTMYARGWIGSDDKALISFFQNSDVETRVEVLGGVGRALMPRNKDQQQVGRPGDEVLQRLVELWESRLRIPGLDKRESAAFGWWFASGAFDDAWSWRNLHAAVADAGRLDGLHFLAERLAVIGPAKPQQAVKVLEDLILNTGEPWAVLEMKEAIRPVLAASVRVGGEATECAVRIINRLGERGYGEYRDLLPTG